MTQIDHNDIALWPSEIASISHITSRFHMTHRDFWISHMDFYIVAFCFVLPDHRHREVPHIVVRSLSYINIYLTQNELVVTTSFVHFNLYILQVHNWLLRVSTTSFRLDHHNLSYDPFGYTRPAHMYKYYTIPLRPYKPTYMTSNQTIHGHHNLFCQKHYMQTLNTTSPLQIQL